MPWDKLNEGSRTIWESQTTHARIEAGKKIRISGNMNNITSDEQNELTEIFRESVRLVDEANAGKDVPANESVPSATPAPVGTTSDSSAPTVLPTDATALESGTGVRAPASKRSSSSSSEN